MYLSRSALLGTPLWVLLMLALPGFLAAGPHPSAPLQQKQDDPLVTPEQTPPQLPLELIIPGKVEVVFSPEAVHQTFTPEPEGRGIERLDLSPEDEKVLLVLRLALVRSAIPQLETREGDIIRVLSDAELRDQLGKPPRTQQAATAFEGVERHMLLTFPPARSPLDICRELQALPLVESCRPRTMPRPLVPVIPDDPDFPSQWGLDADPDADGLVNFTESQLGTDPNRRDSDGDGIADGVEASWVTPSTPNRVPRPVQLPSPPTLRPYRYALSIHAGVTDPKSSFGNLFDQDVLLELGGEYMLSNKFSLNGVLGWYRFEPHFDIAGGALYLRGYLPRSGFRLFGEVGAGLYDPENIDPAFALSVGGGVGRPLWGNWRGEVGVDFFHLFNAGDNIVFLGYKGGIRRAF